MLTGHAEHAKQAGAAKYGEAKGYAGKKAGEAKGWASKKAGEAGEKKGEYEHAGKKYWNEKVEQAQGKAEEAKVEL